VARANNSNEKELIMPNTFITLDVPNVANGAGAPTLVGGTGHPKSFVLTGPVTGRYIVEGSNDGGNTWDILKDDNDGTETLFASQNAGAKSVDCIVERVRVRVARALPTSTPPTITMGAPPALGFNFFGKLGVPEAPGTGAVLDLGLSVGPLKTFVLRGLVPERARFTIQASMDGVRFDEAMLFTSDQQGARSVHVMCRYLRVLRTGGAGAAPVVAVGCEPVFEGTGGSGGATASGPYISFGDESVKATTNIFDEEVIEEFIAPPTSVTGAATNVVAWFSGLGRKGSPEGAGPVTFRLRIGGTPGVADGEIMATAQASSVERAPIVARSSPFVRTAPTLVKITGAGNGEATAVLGGLVVSIEPAPGPSV
jgi:hypothetical protein